MKYGKSMSAISTHVLDTALGKPAAGISVTLEAHANDTWTAIAQSTTDPDGRCRNLITNAVPGLYRLRFDTAAYFAQQQRTSIYSEIVIAFQCATGEAHYHLPLLLSDNSYTTYRGS
jgi:5-hydroxyisourate hydrolase